jgi:predicted metal-dependent enzyme (double-stranded beta helix superfamily)
MFDVDTFVADCTDALGESDSRRAIREVLGRAVADHSAVADSLDHFEGGLNILYRSPELTVLNVVWAPHMSLQPHDHRMWAAIGIYAGQEDNAFYRRQAGSITSSGGMELRTGDVASLGDNTIHAVTNPTRQFTGAIHVYGGDFVGTARSQWDPETFEEQPYDLERILEQFAAANSEAQRDS